MTPANPITRITFSVALLQCLMLISPAHASEIAVNGRALLVGCTTYDHLAPSLHLQGPANDVAIMRDLLCQRFGFPEDRIVMLTESSGRSELRPTRANIEREFKRLGDESQRGEQIVIFLAGHGTQQPDTTPSSDDPEPDGLDELFLPADVQAWDGGIGRVPNAIVDDEIRSWLEVLEQRGAAVTVIVDSCHSGTMTRGIGERSRQVARGVLVPLEHFSEHSNTTQSSPSSVTTSETRGTSKRDTFLDAPSVIAIYAAQSSEATVERLLPADGQDRKPHGLLTYTLVQILSRSTEPMTCRELVQQIQTQYAGWGRSSPTPMIEGLDRDREVFGLNVWPERSRILLTKKGRGWTINAGLLQGLTQGSVLAVFSSAEGQVNARTGYVRVQVVRTIDADVVACDEQGKPLSATLPEKGRCEVVFVDAGNLQLRVAITEAVTADARQVEQVRSVLKSDVVTEQPLLKLVQSPAEADWLIRISLDRILLIPASSGVSDDEASEQRPLNSIGPHAIDSSLADWLSRALPRIARATNLRKIAADESSPTKTGESVRIDLHIEKESSSQPIDDATRPMLKDGDKISIRVSNPCQFPVDVTLLFIDSQQKIDALFPERGEINRLLPGNSLTIPTQVAAEKPGFEHLVAIAVKSQREVMDFTCLAQTGIDETRGDSANATLSSPLGQLLNHAVLSGNSTRGLKQSTVRAHTLKLVSWETQP